MGRSDAFSRRHPTLLAAVLLLTSTIWATDLAKAGEPPVHGVIDVVYIAVGTNYPDSLGVGPGAGVNGAPIILVPTDPPIPGPTQTELLRLDPRTVVIIGGTAVISQAMEDAISTLLPDAVVERIAGANRYDTNSMFVQSIFPVESWVSVSSSAFTSPDPSDDPAVISTTYAYLNSSGNLTAPISLPDGAQILELAAEVFDDDADDDMSVSLWRATASSSAESIAIVASSGDEGDQALSSTAPVPSRVFVDNSTYAYWIESFGTNDMGAGTRRWVRRVFVKYRVGAPGGDG